MVCSIYRKVNQKSFNKKNFKSVGMTLAKVKGVVCSPKCMFFAEYSLLAMFDTYPASKCTTQNMYTRVCAGLVVIVSLRTAL